MFVHRQLRGDNTHSVTFTEGGNIVIVNFNSGGRNTTLLARADYSEILTMVQLFNTTP